MLQSHSLARSWIMLYYFQPVTFSVAECIALWGEPEQAVAWRREEQQSGWLLLLHLCDQGKAEHVHVHVACIRTHLYGHTSTGFDYFSSCTSSTPCSIFCPGLTQSAFFCSAVSAAKCTLSAYAPSPPPLENFPKQNHESWLALLWMSRVRLIACDRV